MSNAIADERASSGAGTRAKEDTEAAPARLGLDPAYVDRGRAALAALEASAPDAGAGEKILHELVGAQVALALAIGDTQVEVVARLGHFINEPRKLLVLAQALKELTTINAVVGRRLEGALTVASTLRSQRRLWRISQS